MTDWFAVFAADGLYTAQDPLDPNIVYYESQGGNISRRNVATGETVNISARTVSIGTYGRADQRNQGSGRSADGRSGEADRRHPRADEARHGRSQRRAALELEYAVLPLGARSERVLQRRRQSLQVVKKGRDPIAISPDLSAHDPDLAPRVERLRRRGQRGDRRLRRHHARRDGRRGERDDLVMNESPIRAGMLFVGTDDGKVWITPNDGGKWIDISDRYAACRR